MTNKKAQDLSIGTLILIVLGIIVLVLLVLGFSIGWSNLFEKINIFGGGSSIGDVVTACNLAVTSQNQFDYCQNFRKIKVSGATEYVNCEDDRVVSGLGNSRLAACADVQYNTETMSPAKKKCSELFDSQGDKFKPEEVKVNSQTCQQILGLV